MARVARRIFDFLLDLFLSESSQVRLGLHIVNRARGDNNYDPETNGEYWALRKIKKQFESSKPVILDVGAHMGCWSQEAAAGLPPGAAVHSFEPAGATFASLKETIDKAGLAGVVHPVNAALGDKDGSATLYVDGELCGTNSLYQQRYEEPWRDVARPKALETVRLMRGDTFCRQKDIGRVHFLKIDAESHEVPVLRGFEEMLSRHAIDYIQFEYFHGWINAGHFLYEAVELLHRKKYKVGKLRGNRVLFMDAYDASYEKFEFANYFAARTELAPLWL